MATATLKKIYGAAVEIGIAADPRGSAAVKKDLELEKRKFEKLPEDEKKFYDLERLSNPYADTRILNGPGDTAVKRALVGIDMEAPEVLLAHALGTRGRKIDLLIGHHPEGTAYARFYDVMKMQAEIFNKAGVPINVAEALTGERMSEVSRRVAPANHQRAVDAARLMGAAFLCVHTPADNCVTTHLTKLFAAKKPERLDEVLALLKKIPEYEIASREGAGPSILVGEKSRRAGKIMVDMTGGTEGSKNIFDSLATSGVGTVVAMHLSEDHYKKAKENHVNVIVAGHISSDNLGLNLLLDRTMEKTGEFEIDACSGFRRIKR